MKHIKKAGVKHSSSNRILIPSEPPDYDAQPPIFSLEKLVCGNRCLSALDRDHKAFFADAMFKRRELTWQQIKSIPKHGLGFENIAKNSIKASIPAFVTDEIDHFIAFRFNGKKAMVGFRRRDVFYVLWFDHDYTLYNH